MAFIDNALDLDFESGCGTVSTPFPAPHGAPAELLDAARAAHQAREAALTVVDEAEHARAEARRAEAEDKQQALDAARKGNGYAPRGPGLLALFDEADQRARAATWEAQSAYFAYSDLYNEIMADPERRTAWLARIMPDHDTATTQMQTAHQAARAQAARVAALRTLMFKLAGKPHTTRQLVGGAITDGFLIDYINTVTVEPNWLPIARDLIDTAQATDTHDTGKDAA